MGKIRELFERASEPIDNQSLGSFALGIDYTDINGDGMMRAAEIWTLTRYMTSLQETAPKGEEWDELERSVVAKLADEVQVGIMGDTVELTIEKNMAAPV